MRLSSRSFRTIAAHAVAAVALASGGLLATAVPAQANHVAAMTVTQVGNDGAYVTIQVDLSYTGANGASYFDWDTGNGRSGWVEDGVTSGVYAGDASGSGTFSGGSGALATFTWTRTQPAANVARTRITYAYPASGVYQVTWSDCCPDVSGTTAVSVASGFPACSDTIDNDRDGTVDYPADAGCASADDNAEFAECPPVAGVAFCLEPGDIEIIGATAYNYDVIITTARVVVGRIDRYNFNVGGVNVRLSCVILAASAVNACERAGGTFVEPVSILAVDAPWPSVVPQDEPLASVGVCNAELTFTVLGDGVQSAPAYAICDSGAVSF